MVPIFFGFQQYVIYYKVISILKNTTPRRSPGSPLQKWIHLMGRVLSFVKHIL